MVFVYLDNRPYFLKIAGAKRFLLPEKNIGFLIKKILRAPRASGNKNIQ
jgi:hypothetical protein